MPILPSTASDLETQRLMIPVDVGILQVEKQRNYFVSLYDYFKTFVNVNNGCLLLFHLFSVGPVT